ncbi:BON domain-containing protein [Draconibacterium halophilum]|uniref:BON domain-containing protein n=1 Tax=Draconibacterium halophilum TaxID=2706887 RepID=A0A6C0RBM3_9BACT|nr:BON domain-containing protein [Draconibacterium halophilum]QIA07406.1 BON domain-containing protein [Draconibacterium halophilum]
MKPLPEEIIKKNIIDRLTNNDAVNINNIHVSITDGFVQLQGHVPSYSAKIEALRDATEAAKDFNVVNELQVNFQPNQPTVSDKEITENIHQYFKWQKSINPTSVKVEVDNGKVVLSGQVENESESIAAEKIASSTKGVIDMDNQIRVAPKKVSNDTHIQQALKEAFEKSALIDEHKIVTEVEKGVVYISGCVANDPIRKEIEDQVVNTKGVNKVVNKITVG